MHVGIHNIVLLEMQIRYMFDNLAPIYIPYIEEMENFKQLTMVYGTCRVFSLFDGAEVSLRNQAICWGHIGSGQVGAVQCVGLQSGPVSVVAEGVVPQPVSQ